MGNQSKTHLVRNGRRRTDLRTEAHNGRNVMRHFRNLAGLIGMKTRMTFAAGSRQREVCIEYYRSEHIRWYSGSQDGDYRFSRQHFMSSESTCEGDASGVCTSRLSWAAVNNNTIKLIEYWIHFQSRLYSMVERSSNQARPIQTIHKDGRNSQRIRNCMPDPSSRPPTGTLVSQAPPLGKSAYGGIRTKLRVQSSHNRTLEGHGQWFVHHSK